MKNDRKYSYVSAYPELVSEWSPENEADPGRITSGSHKMILWKGSCGHEWKAMVKNRVRGSGCPYCSGNKVLPGYNDLATKRPELAEEWSQKNSPLTADQVHVFSNRSVWWKGSCGHEWRSRIADRSSGHGCPFCEGKLLAGFNDLATTSPELIEEWSETNELYPTGVSAKSRKQVWWKCRSCGFLWKASISTRVNGSGCPDCRRARTQQNYREMLERRKRKREERYYLPMQSFEYYTTRAGVAFLRCIDSEIGIPLQYYLPERRIAIEFSEPKSMTKSHRQKDEVKNLLCLRRRIRLIRILAPGIKEFANCLCISRTDSSPDTLSEAINALFTILGYDEDIDIVRDLEDIRTIKLHT